ncbi:hypothetical protein [Streptomyces sp. NPDC049040]|uniref:hypothetical protein n=1 Tax=Streptomyces sp. NPDC049040 TaxID=3365593 RepID=UPI0037243560
MSDVSESPAAPEPAAVAEPVVAGPAAEPVPVPVPEPVAAADPAAVPVPAGPPPYPPPPPAYAPQGVAAARGMSPRLRVALRWTSVLLVFAVFGAGTAYAVTRPERTKIPGLRTPDDGRWKYPPIALPKLPARKPRPLDTARNPAGVHYADLRSLLVPLPEGAAADPAFPGAKGWLPTAGYLKASQGGGGGKEKEQYLKQEGLRHIAARAWTMPDGTRTEVYLLQLISAGYANVVGNDADGKPVDGVTTDQRDRSLVDGTVPKHETVSGYGETAPYGDSMTRFAYVTSGDTVALVRQTRSGGAVPEQAFRQTVRLQAQLLG